MLTILLRQQPTDSATPEGCEATSAQFTGVSRELDYKQTKGKLFFPRAFTYK